MGGAAAQAAPGHPSNPPANPAPNAAGDSGPNDRQPARDPSKPDSTSPAGGIGSSQLSSTVFGGGPIVGVASTSKATTIREFNHKNHYNQWQFIYDPTMDRGGLITTPAQPALQSAAPLQQQNSSSPNSLWIAGLFWRDAECAAGAAHAAATAINLKIHGNDGRGRPSSIIIDFIRL